jgi:hypothetical protein
MTLCEMITGRVPYFDIGDLDVGIKIRDTNLLPKLPLNAPPLLVTICKVCVYTFTVLLVSHLY